jgi:serine/threonine protein kinase
MSHGLSPASDGCSAPGDVSFAPVKVVNGKYVLERQLGGGGMAEVFLGRTVGAEGFSRPVAIKRIRDGFARDPMFANMFIAEAQLTARLQHANIVSVLDFDRDPEGGLFLVMELVDGVDLRHLLARGRLPLSLVVHIAIEILRGLDHAHELPISADGVRGIIHRDLSPENVLLSWDGSVKISDFGVAKARAASRATASVLIKGKPSYMSPEQVNGGPLDGRSDLFAVGIMMFEMLCARPPFSGGTIQEICGQVLYMDIPRVRDIRPEVPEDLSRVVASLLTREFDHRMRSAEAAITALVTCVDCPRAGREQLIDVLSQHFADRAPIRPRNISHASHTDPTIVAAASAIPRGHEVVTVTAPGVVAVQRTRSHRWAWPVLAGLTVIAAVLAVLVSGRARVPSTAEPTAAKRAPGAAAPFASGLQDTAAGGSAVPATRPADQDTAKPPSDQPGAATATVPAMQPTTKPPADAAAPHQVPERSATSPGREHARTPARQPQNTARTTGGIREIQLGQ